MTLQQSLHDMSADYQMRFLREKIAWCEKSCFRDLEWRFHGVRSVVF